MEPGPRRRRTSHPLVAAFLRDPGSGRVYRRGELIGKGASSRCYLLTDMCSGAVFALKVVPRGGSLRGKVEREVALHSCLRHRNVVALHGHFADRDHVYLVLEYCSRQSLAHVLKARQRLTEPEVRYYLRGLVSGLRHLHQRRIVHRDLKPSNFFLNDSMEVKIGDLGLAARVGPGGRCHRVLCGTPNFLAPEVISRNGHSCQSDIWALGCTMYTALTGSPPFAGAPLAELFQNIRAGRYAEPAHLSPGARRLLARLLAPEPAARPSLDLLLQDDFFTQGFTPERLPAHSCRRPPGLALPQPLRVILRKVGRLVLSPRRAPGPSTEVPGPEAGLETESAAWASESGGLRAPSPPPTRSPEGASGGSRQAAPGTDPGTFWSGREAITLLCHLSSLLCLLIVLLCVSCCVILLHQLSASASSPARGSFPTWAGSQPGPACPHQAALGTKPWTSHVMSALSVHSLCVFLCPLLFLSAAPGICVSFCCVILLCQLSVCAAPLLG
nr:inactive serine/threonine-protein kinase PLK5 isoform X2 [Dasypus novemcinctus]